jgi:hypothetical protein
MWNGPLKDAAMLEELTESVKETNALVEPESQADPKFQTPLTYTRITAIMPNAGLCRPRPGCFGSFGCFQGLWNRPSRGRRSIIRTS